MAFFPMDRQGPNCDKLALRMNKLVSPVPPVLVCLAVLTACQTPARPPETRLSASSIGLFPIRKDGKTGYINREGKLVIGNQFDSAGEFSEGLANICVGPCKFIKNNPKEEISYDQTWQGMHGYINVDGKITINPRFTSSGQFHRGLAFASTVEFRLDSTDHPMKYGYIDTSGNFVIPEQFQSASDFDESGLAVVCVGQGDESRCGFIDNKGRYVINPQFYSAQAFHDGLAWVIEKKDMTTSYVDRSGRIVWKGEPEWETVK